MCQRDSIQDAVRLALARHDNAEIGFDRHRQMHLHPAQASLDRYGAPAEQDHAAAVVRARVECDLRHALWPCAEVQVSLLHCHRPSFRFVFGAVSSARESISLTTVVNVPYSYQL